MSFGYYVTRQAYYYEQVDAVEIADGKTVDVIGPDWLGTKWPKLGEGQKFDHPRDAVRAAIKISRAWNKPIAVNGWRGFGGAATIIESPFELLEWLHKEQKRMVPCIYCGSNVHPANVVSGYGDYSDLQYCSEQCAVRAAEDEWLYDESYDPWDYEYVDEEEEWDEDEWELDDEIPF